MNTVFNEVVKVLIAIVVCYFIMYLPALYIQDNYIVAQIRCSGYNTGCENSLLSYIKFMLIMFSAYYINKIVKKIKKIELFR